MSMYVYEDEDRTKKVLARNTTERDKGIRYYCPNPKCEARMFLWNTEGESKSFFRSAGKPGHVEHCPYGSENTYNPENTKEDGFDIEDAISNLMVPTASASKTNKTEPREQGAGTSDKEIVPHTIKQIYDMCKAHYCKDTFNNQVIGQLLLDDRSIFMYPKGIYGSRFIEAKCRAKLYDGMNIYLETPIGTEEYQLKLKFQDIKLFREIRDLLYNNRNHVIVVGGKWESSGEYNCFATEFSSKKQIKVLKQVI